MILVQLKDGTEFEAPKDNVSNIKRMFFGQIKNIKPVGQKETPSPIVIGSSNEDLKKRGRPKATN